MSENDHSELPFTIVGEDVFKSFFNNIDDKIEAGRNSEECSALWWNGLLSEFGSDFLSSTIIIFVNPNDALKLLTKHFGHKKIAKQKLKVLNREGCLENFFEDSPLFIDDCVPEGRLILETESGGVSMSTGKIKCLK